MISVILFNMSKHSDFHLIFFQFEGAWQDFTVVTKLIKNFKSLYGFGGCFLKVRDIYMDFEPYFKVHNLVSVHHKSIILGQMTNPNMILNVVVSVYRLVKIWNSPLFSVEFQNGQLRKCQQKAMIKKPTNLKLTAVPCWISQWPVAKVPATSNDQKTNKYFRSLGRDIFVKNRHFRENSTLYSWSPSI